SAEVVDESPLILSLVNAHALKGNFIEVDGVRRLLDQLFAKPSRDHAPWPEIRAERMQHENPPRTGRLRRSRGDVGEQECDDAGGQEYRKPRPVCGPS